MSSLKVTDNNNELISAIPPLICNNPREKIEPEQVHIKEIFGHQKQKLISTENATPVIFYKSNVPCPRFPLSIVWSPAVVLFEIDNSPKLQKVRIWNICSRSIYILYCGLWGENARLGASWRCFPRTRCLLSPGLTADLFIQAIPRHQAPVPSAQIGLQLATAHKRDNVVGYFVIPIVVKFKKYVKPCLEEEEISKGKMD